MLAYAPKLPLDAISAAVREGFGLEGDYAALSGERDQNHRLKAAQGQFVVKVCNPAEGFSVVECQVLALAHIAGTDPGLPVPRVVKSKTGALFHRFTQEGVVYPLVVLSWLEGRVAGEGEISVAQFRRLGSLIGRLCKALRGFVHPAPAGRDLVWDPTKAFALRKHLPLVEPARRAIVAAALDESEKLVARMAPNLPAQIIHADVHPFNVLLDASGNFSGIIDFGDMMHGTRVMDLTNAMADCLLGGRDLERVASAMTAGFVQHVPLEEGEVELILPLLRARLAVSVLVTVARRHGDATVTTQVDGLDVQSLDVLEAISNDGLLDSIRYAANFGPKRAAGSESMMARRVAAMGPRPLLFYKEPLHMVRGDGVWLISAEQRPYLDCYNNVPHVGHGNPHVAEAVARQLRVLNTNTRYLTDESVAYAEALKATLDSSLDAVIFVNSGSEANDVAYRMARCWNGSTGMLIMDFAYHGVTDASDAMSPSNYPAGKFDKPHVRELPSPDTYRGPFRKGGNDLGERYAALADEQIASLKAAGHGLAITVIDSAFMTNGIIDAPPGYVQGIVARTHAAGGLFVADEVQSGFGRMGPAMWGHQHHGVVPDFVTIGKPAGNGYPVGAIITRSEILDRFVAETGPFFSTFGGGNAACAAGLAVLDVIKREDLANNAARVGDYLRQGLRGLMAKHTLVGDVRGTGLAIGVELVRDRETLEPAREETKAVINLLKDEGVLMGTDGRLGNVLKIRPPIVFTTKHADMAVRAMDKVLTSLR